MKRPLNVYEQKCWSRDKRENISPKTCKWIYKLPKVRIKRWRKLLYIFTNGDKDSTMIFFLSQL